MPRLTTCENEERRKGLMSYSQVDSIIMTVKEHNRVAGTFDYNYPQNFYSTYPEIDQESYITLGAPQNQRRVHATNYNTEQD